MVTPLRLLMLEDNPDDAEIVLHALRQADFDPVAECVETEHDFIGNLDPAPEVILADFTMPEFDSLRALEIIQERRLDIPFIIVSGTIGEERAVQVMQRGASDYVIKDRLGRLGQAVRQALANSQFKVEKARADQTIAKLAAIVESSSDAIVAKCPNGIILSWNLAAERLYGYTSAEIIGKNVAVLFPTGRRRAEAPENFQDVVRRISQGNDYFAYDSVRVRKDGRRIEVRLSISPIRDSRGVLSGVSAIGQDITRQRRSERFHTAEQAVTSILSDATNLQEAGPKILQTIAECLRWEVAALWMVDAKANVLRCTYRWHSTWAEPGLIEALSQKATLAPGVGVAGRAWSTGEPVSESGLKFQIGEAGWPEVEGLRCGFGLPMRQNSAMVGVIEFYNREIREMDESLVRSLDNIGSQVVQFCERRRTEAALHRSEEQFRQLADAMPQIVWTATPSGTTDYLNERGYQFSGCVRETAPDHCWRAIVHPDDLARAIDAWDLSIRTGDPLDMQIRLIEATTGRPRWFLLRAVAGLNAEGLVAHWYGTATDIDDQRKSLEELRISEERFRTLVMSLPAAVFTTDPKGRITLFNDRAVELWGRRPDLETDFWTGTLIYLHSDGAPLTPDEMPMAVTLHGGYFARGQELIIQRPDGSRSYVLAHPELLRDAAGEIIGAVNMLVDITQMKKLEEQFRQAQKMEAVGRLAAGVAHDFNNMLTVINGYGELIARRLGPTDRNREMLDGIIRAGERATGLTRQLLAFSRQQVACPQVLNLNGLLAEAEKMLRRLIGEDIEFKAIKDPALGNIKADPGELEQVLLNVAVNARDAMPCGGKLTVATENVELGAEQLSDFPECAPGPYVLLAVTDNGCGMDEATRSRVFEPFFTTKGTRGTGLGLATVFGIASQLHAKIEVLSELDKGTTFKIFFPRVSEPVAPELCPSSVPENLHGSETILVAEDDAGVRALIQHCLRESGYTVLEAPNGAEAIRIFAEHADTIDLLITDVVMPRMSGRELADHLAQKWPEIKAIFMSGYTDDTVIRNGVHHAQSDFLQKPFSSEALALKVREVLNSP